MSAKGAYLLECPITGQRVQNHKADSTKSQSREPKNMRLGRQLKGLLIIYRTKNKMFFNQWKICENEWDSYSSCSLLNLLGLLF